MKRSGGSLTLRNGRPWRTIGPELVDLVLREGRVESVHPGGSGPPSEREVDLGGRLLLPGLLNGHDHLDLGTLPALVETTRTNAAEWLQAVEDARAACRPGSLPDLPPVDTLFLGGLRNLLAGVTSVAHHGAFHRSLARPDFPVRVLERCQFARSFGSAEELHRTYRSTDRRIPWTIHAAEGTDEASAGDIERLAEANLLRQNTVILRGLALRDSDAGALATARAALIWCPEADRRQYGRTLRLPRLREAGVAVGLGSDSPLTGSRDLLSTLSVAAEESGLAAEELLVLATEGTAAAARLVPGGLEPGAPADLLVTGSLERLLAGDRRAVELVMVAGEARYGAAGLLAALRVPAAPLVVDGAERSLAASTARRAAALVGRTSGRRRAGWLEGLSFGQSPPASREPRGLV